MANRNYTQKVRTASGYDFMYPKTTSEQVILNNSNFPNDKTIDAALNSLSGKINEISIESGGIPAPPERIPLVPTMATKYSGSAPSSNFMTKNIWNEVSLNIVASASSDIVVNEQVFTIPTGFRIGVFMMYPIVLFNSSSVPIHIGMLSIGSDGNVTITNLSYAAFPAGCRSFRARISYSAPN